MVDPIPHHPAGGYPSRKHALDCLEELASLLEEGWAAECREIGYEKMCYLGGGQRSSPGMGGATRSASMLRRQRRRPRSGRSRSPAPTTEGAMTSRACRAPTTAWRAGSGRCAGGRPDDGASGGDSRTTPTARRVGVVGPGGQRSRASGGVYLRGSRRVAARAGARAPAPGALSLAQPMPPAHANS